MTDLELRSCLDVEPGLRAMSLDDDGVVAGVTVVDVADREPVAAPGNAHVVLGSVLEIEPVLKPLRTRVRLGHFALERGRLTETRYSNVG